MAANYKRLWDLLISRDMKKEELCVKAGISMSSLERMVRGEDITIEVLAKICIALDCTANDVVEFVDNSE